MKTIQRNIPPACLERQPVTQSWEAFAGTLCHTELSLGLIHEQSGLCCYCESLATDGAGHIEHMEPRSKNPKRTYDATNLAISCNGGTAQHCGHFKDAGHNGNYSWDSGRFSYPHDPATCSLFSYDNLGNVNPSDYHPVKAGYMIGYLNLNCPSLVQRRHSHAISLIETLGEQPEPNTISLLCDYYLKPDTRGCLQPYYSLSQAILNP